MVALTISIHILFNMNLTFSFINFLWGFWLRLLDGGALWAAVHGVAEGQTRLSDFTFTFHFHSLEEEMAPYSSTPAWRIPGMGEPGGLLSMGSHRVGHDWSDLAAAALISYWIYILICGYITSLLNFHIEKLIDMFLFNLFYHFVTSHSAYLYFL